MQFREGTPVVLMIEMYFAVLWLPVLIAVFAAIGSIFVYRTGYRRRLLVLITLLLSALVAIWLGAILGGMALLEHPRYRAYVECDPCF
ncbi:hypothetical protein D4A92_06475 [Rhizobium rosettiformans]|uniref:Uncharacterized protein n=1 Tax=Rhizobium rosettiformans TaxID=1368430 RepID=A0ABX7ERY7_9HYPH|nr:hypothetical protein [Rhizobium rosettiformans]QRF51105.1 hypothetical protein D4A92_06475 [Rhizobium rosettiformans]